MCGFAQMSHIIMHLFSSSQQGLGHALRLKADIGDVDKSSKMQQAVYRYLQAWAPGDRDRDRQTDRQTDGQVLIDKLGILTGRVRLLVTAVTVGFENCGGRSVIQSELKTVVGGL